MELPANKVSNNNLVFMSILRAQKKQLACHL